MTTAILTVLIGAAAVVLFILLGGIDPGIDFGTAVLVAVLTLTAVGALWALGSITGIMPPELTSRILGLWIYTGSTALTIVITFIVIFVVFLILFFRPT